MIEIKDATITVAGKTLLENCSFMAREGQKQRISLPNNKIKKDNSFRYEYS